MTGIIKLEAQELRIDEDDGFVSVAIVRTGDTSGAVDINYAVTPSTATAGQDYVPVSGIITMAAGQTRVVVPVQIIDDNLAELTETFVFSIVNINSGTLLAPRTTRIDIADNEVVTPDPVDPPLSSDYDVSRHTEITGLVNPISFEWSPVDSSIMYIAEKGGRIRVYDTDTHSFKGTFLDIRSEVNEAGDRGLMDIALDPNFATNHYIYAFYVVDPAETAGKTGNAGPDGYGNRYAQVVRYQADPATDYTTVLANSKVILLGGAGTGLNSISGAGAIDSTLNFTQRASDVNPTTGAYVQDYLKVDSDSHAGGALEFGPDGKLYVSVGDGTSYNAVDKRGISVQSVDALAGKILRIDPMTGDGFADNPFYVPGNSLDANSSKVYQLGLRNPFAISFDSVGKLLISETGWESWEEINVGGPGANFGWPFYEGGDGGTLLPTVGYKDMPEAIAVYQGVANGTIEITPAFRAFSHSTSAPGYQVQAIVGANDVIHSDKYPTGIQNDYIFTDISQGEIYAVDVDNRNELKFLYREDGFVPVHFKQGPDGYMYYASLLDGTIGRFIIESPPTNFVVNGNLEALRMTSPNFFQSYTNGQVPGWNNLNVANGVELIRYNDDQKLDTDTIGGLDTLYQDIQTQAGRTYTLKFDAIANVVGSADFDVLWNGVVIATVRPGDTNQTYSYTVTGTGGNDRLAFREFAAQDDNTGALLDEIKLILQGTTPPTAPVANNDTFTTAFNTPLNGTTVLANDTDANGDALTAAVVTGPAHGTLTLNANGTFLYTPTAGYSGADSFTYRANDGTANSNTATVALTVSPSQPTGTDLIVNGNLETLRMTAATYWQSYTNGQVPGWNNTNTTGIEVVRSNNDQKLDLDVVGTADQIYQDVTTVAGRAYTLKFDAYASQVGSSAFDVLWNGNVVASIIPTAANQTYTFSVTGTGGSNRLSFRELTAENNGNGAYLDNVSLIGQGTTPPTAPVANNDTFTTAFNTPLNGTTVLANDTDANGDVLTAAVVTGPAHGTLTLNANGTFLYTPTTGYSGADSFTYRANDGTANSNTATVALTVSPSTPPTGTELIVNGNLETLRMTAATYWQSYTNGQVPGWNNTNTTGIEVVRANNDQKLDLDVVGTADQIYQDVTTVAGASYTLKFDAYASQVGSSAFDVLWNGNVVASITPTATNQSYTFAVTGTGGANRLSFRELVAENNGNGAYLDNVSLTGSATGPVPPVANNDSFTTAFNTALNGTTVLANDTDANGDALTAGIVTGPAHGTLTLNANGTFLYTPTTGYSGADSFTYRANDGTADSNTATVALTVSPDTPPTGTNLIVNGDLETVRMTAATYWQSYTNGQIPGWNNTNTTGIEVVRSNANQKLDLDVVGTADQIYQDVTTVAGQTYTLKFDSFASQVGSSSFDVLWNGNIVASITPTAANQTYTFSVTGTGGSNRLSFRELTAENNGNGAYLDDVSLTSTTPAALAAADTQDHSVVIPDNHIIA